MSDLNDVINNICRDLPEGYQIIIECENGYGGVKLLAPGTDTEIECYNEENTIEQKINELMDVAKSGDYDEEPDQDPAVEHSMEMAEAAARII